MLSIENASRKIKWQSHSKKRRISQKILPKTGLLTFINYLHINYGEGIRGSDMVKEILVKGVSIGIIILFMSLTALPALSMEHSFIGGETNREQGIAKTMNDCVEGRDSNTIEIELTEYRSKGACETQVIELPLEAVREILKTFQKPQGSMETFRILKKHGLVPRDTLLEDWRKGMYNQAKTLDILPGDIQDFFQVNREAARLKLPFLASAFNRVDAVSIIGSRIRVGVPFYRGLLKLMTHFRFVDLFDICGGLVGIISTKNVIRQHSFVAIPSAIGMIGFVGVHIHIPFILNIYTGFSALTLAGGLGIHTVDVLPWLSNSNPG